MIQIFLHFHRQTLWKNKYEQKGKERKEVKSCLSSDLCSKVSDPCLLKTKKVGRKSIDLHITSFLLFSPFFSLYFLSVFFPSLSCLPSHVCLIHRTIENNLSSKCGSLVIDSNCMSTTLSSWPLLVSWVEVRETRSLLSCSSRLTVCLCLTLASFNGKRREKSCVLWEEKNKMLMFIALTEPYFFSWSLVVLFESSFDSTASITSFFSSFLAGFPWLRRMYNIHRKISRSQVRGSLERKRETRKGDQDDQEAMKEKVWWFGKEVFFLYTAFFTL